MPPFQATGEDIDFDLLATYLKALANPVRLELLWRLRSPRDARDVHVRPRRRDALSPERPIALQTLVEHLQRLEEIGVVLQMPAATDAGADARVGQWLTSVPNVFALVEEMGKLAAIPVHDALTLPETTAMPADLPPTWPPGPKLVVLHGPWRGRCLPLSGAGPWSVGRSRKASVSLHYDPFVSASHAVLRRAGDGFVLEPEPGSRNPASVNFASVLTARPMRHGDVLGLGRSLLLLHTA